MNNIILFLIFFLYSNLASALGIYKASKVEVLDQRIHQGVEFVRPRGITFPLLKLGYLSAGGMRANCLGYKISANEDNGELLLYSGSDDCKDLEQIIESERIAAKLYIKYDKERSSLTLNSRSIDFRALAYDGTKFKLNNFIFLEKIKSRSKTYNEGDYCLQFDKKCNQVVSESCEKCPGSFQFVSGECPMKIEKVCRSSCGGEREVACFRGLDFATGLSLDCAHQNKAFKCREGLNVYCHDNGLHICL